MLTRGPNGFKPPARTSNRTLSAVTARILRSPNAVALQRAIRSLNQTGGARVIARSARQRAKTTRLHPSETVFRYSPGAVSHCGFDDALLEALCLVNEPLPILG